MSSRSDVLRTMTVGEAFIAGLLVGLSILQIATTVQVHGMTTAVESEMAAVNARLDALDRDLREIDRIILYREEPE